MGIKISEGHVSNYLVGEITINAKVAKRPLCIIGVTNSKTNTRIDLGVSAEAVEAAWDRMVRAGVIDATLVEESLL